MSAFTVAVLSAMSFLGSESKKPIEQYVSKLAAAEPTAEAQFRLALWARKQGMADVADGHLRAAVYIDRMYEAAQKALGRTFRDGLWESKVERNVRLKLEEKLRKEITVYRGLLNDRGTAALREAPLTESGVAALEEFSSLHPERVLEVIALIARSDHGAATLALIRIAVGARSSDARRAAADVLVDRNPEHYLATLLEYIRPQRSGKMSTQGVGEIWYWQQGTTMFVAMPVPPRAERTELIRLRSGEAATLEVGNLNRREPSEVERAHGERESVRANAITALQRLTGAKIGDDFDQWRQAVMNLTGTSVTPGRLDVDSISPTYYEADMIVLNRIRPHQCFAANTQVATKRGLVSIDRVCVGELVLSRNVESGETTYKPVLGRTLRPRTAMKTLSIGGETLQATYGHPFWSDDKGWVKVQHLKERDLLGGEESNVKLDKVVECGDLQQAYNLVVADFGTFFVGKSKLLVHDNTPIREAMIKR